MSDSEQSEVRKEITLLEDGLQVVRYQNNSQREQSLHHPSDSNYLQFHFCLKNSITLLYNEGSYKLPLNEQFSYMLYNPKKDLPVNLVAEAGAWYVAMLIPIRQFHSLFSSDADVIGFLSEPNKRKKYYVQGDISPAMAVALHQIMNYNLSDSIKRLYFKSKSYELLSLYFNERENADLEACPFLVDEENVRRIKRAKEIIMEDMAEPPTLSELSREIGLPLKKLKKGFKELYGNTVYGYLLDHKMEYARQLLDSGKYNVNEAGIKVGYSSASHFIAAFKKKYGTTPKRYITGG